MEAGVEWMSVMEPELVEGLALAAGIGGLTLQAIPISALLPTTTTQANLIKPLSAALSLVSQTTQISML